MAHKRDDGLWVIRVAGEHLYQRIHCQNLATVFYQERWISYNQPGGRREEVVNYHWFCGGHTETLPGSDLLLERKEITKELFEELNDHYPEAIKIG